MLKRWTNHSLPVHVPSLPSYLEHKGIYDVVPFCAVRFDYGVFHWALFNFEASILFGNQCSSGDRINVKRFDHLGIVLYKHLHFNQSRFPEIVFKTGGGGFESTFNVWSIQTYGKKW